MLDSESLSVGTHSQRRKGFVTYLFRQRWPYLVTVVVIAAVAIAIWLGFASAEDTLDRLLAVPVSMATLLVAIAIGFMNMRREWVDSLPWVLSLRIRLVGPGTDGTDPGPRTVAVFYDIPMASPANAREWSQQLASKVMTPERLPLSLFTVDLTDDIVHAGKARFRRMAISYGVQRVPERKPHSEETYSMPREEGSSVEPGTARPALAVRMKDEFASGGVFIEDVDLQLTFCGQSTESLDKLWATVEAGKPMQSGEK